MSATVNHRSADVQAMAENWPIIEALMGGTLTMRKAAKDLLPQWPNEDDESYDARLKTATLFPAFRRTVNVMSGKPFSKPLTLSKDTPEQILQWSEDIDREGVNLHSFAVEMFTEALAFGLCGILVEAPKIETRPRPQTRQEQKVAGIRPYWVRVKHDQILGGRIRRENGSAVLTQLRILECDQIDDGDYGEKEVQRVRVLTPGKFRVYEATTGANNSSAWTLKDEGTTGLNFIPFVPMYGLRKRFMYGLPPLMELAHLNVKHWQSQSDQDTILHVARVPILFMRGFADDAQVTVGAKSAVKASDEHAEMKYVEHTGKCIEAGRLSIQDLEEQMIQSGAELLVKKEGNRSATESANDAEGNKCDLQRMTEVTEDALDLALYYTAQYASLPKGGNVSLFKDFAANSLSEASATVINDMQSRGMLTKVTAIKEQQRRGIISSDIDPEKEAAAAEAEGPAPGTMTDDDVDDQ